MGSNPIPVTAQLRISFRYYHASAFRYHLMFVTDQKYSITFNLHAQYFVNLLKQHLNTKLQVMPINISVKLFNLKSPHVHKKAQKTIGIHLYTIKLIVTVPLAPLVIILLSQLKNINAKFSIFQNLAFKSYF